MKQSVLRRATVAVALTYVLLPAHAKEPIYVTKILDERTGLKIRHPFTNDLYQYYSQSHALLIGQSTYIEWRKLPAVRQEVIDLRNALEKHRFKVEVHLDLKAADLINVIESFMRRRAMVPDSRILVYVAGHGWHRSPLDRPLGYLVPVDAPKESQDRNQAIKLAASSYPMTHFASWAQSSDARHMLFIFDSCFSGSFFGRPSSGAPFPSQTARIQPAVTQARSARPKPVTVRGAEADDVIFQPGSYGPGRQFLTAGSQNEIAPDDSIFTRLLIDILNGRRSQDVQVNFDHWLTAKEFGEWLAMNTRREYRGKNNPI